MKKSHRVLMKKEHPILFSGGEAVDGKVQT
jgi:hypothetical protein